MPRAQKTHRPPRVGPAAASDRSGSRRLRSSGRYQKFRAWLRHRQPLCADPFGDHAGESAAGGCEPGRELHHVKRLSEHPETLCDSGECVMLCRRCHGRITRMEHAGQPTAHLFPEHWREHAIQVVQA